MISGDELLGSLSALRDAARGVGPAAPGEGPVRGGQSSSGASFADEVSGLLRSTNHQIENAEHSARELAAGRGDVVETMMALGRADTSLRFVVTLRNRALEAYQEISRLQV